MDSRDVSGPAKQLLAVAESANAIGVDYRLALFRRGPRDTPLIAAAQRRGLEPMVISGEYQGDPAELMGLFRAVRTPGIDLVQTHGYKPNVLMALIRSV